MNYLTYLMKFIAFIPSIAASINAIHAGKSVDEKISAGAASLATATAIASAVLPDNEGKLAQVAGDAAQAVLAETLKALHAAQAV